MNRKLIGFALLCIFLISSSTTSVVGTDIAEEKFTEICSLSAEENETTTVISTGGPLPRRTAKITVHNGQLSQVRKIQKITNRKVLQFLRPIAIIPVTHLDFSVKYRRDILFALSDFSYGSTLVEYVNGSMVNRTSIVNEKHTLQITDFTGMFIFFRGKIKPFRPFKFRPPQFVFVGNCESVTILT